MTWYKSILTETGTFSATATAETPLMYFIEGLGIPILATLIHQYQNECTFWSCILSFLSKIWGVKNLGKLVSGQKCHIWYKMSHILKKEIILSKGIKKRFWSIFLVLTFTDWPNRWIFTVWPPIRWGVMFHSQFLVWYLLTRGFNWLGCSVSLACCLLIMIRRTRG